MHPVDTGGATVFPIAGLPTGAANIRERLRRQRRSAEPRLTGVSVAKRGNQSMALYELRTYTLQVGKMAELAKLYQEIGMPLLTKRGYDKQLIGFFQADTGTINQIVFVLKFEDDAARRAYWAKVYADPDFLDFASKGRPLLISQEVKLLLPAPWGPHP
jgi:hypothetical protein